MKLWTHLEILFLSQPLLQLTENEVMMHMALYLSIAKVFFKCLNGIYYVVIFQFNLIFSGYIKVFCIAFKIFAKYLLSICKFEFDGKLLFLFWTGNTLSVQI